MVFLLPLPREEDGNRQVFPGSRRRREVDDRGVAGTRHRHRRQFADNSVEGLRRVHPQLHGFGRGGAGASTARTIAETGATASSAMPHFEQLPGPGCRTSGCIGHVYPLPPFFSPDFSARLRGTDAPDAPGPASFLSCSPSAGVVPVYFPGSCRNSDRQ